MDLDKNERAKNARNLLSEKNALERVASDKTLSQEKNQGHYDLSPQILETETRITKLNENLKMCQEQIARVFQMVGSGFPVNSDDGEYHQAERDRNIHRMLEIRFQKSPLCEDLSL